jgi:peptidoglycan hydrolase-like protein with peptidoglycan-binding domain
MLSAACGGEASAPQQTQEIDTGTPGETTDTGIVPLEPPAQTGPQLQVSLPESGLLGPQSEGEEVETLEHALSALGYDPGSADGLFDQRTRRAVIAFQRDHKLEPDGIVGPMTAKAINADLAERANGDPAEG